jgi:hypothetical protein
MYVKGLEKAKVRLDMLTGLWYVEIARINSSLEEGN